MQSSMKFGLSCALALPLNEDLNIDCERLKAHARRCLEAGCSSVTIFGTTGEGASISLAERRNVLAALSASGADLRRQVFGGVTATSVGDAVEQARVVIERDCCGLLLSPPFYFKDVDDEGLYRWFSQVFETIGREARNVILYHIPSVTQIALSINLINRLKAAFPALVTGVKDSGSDWAYTRKLLLDAPDDLLVLIGNERHLADGIQRGAHGAISGLANLCPGVLLKTLETGVRDSRIDDLATEILKFPFAAAVKALLAHRQGDSTWLNVRPPLQALSPADASRLTAACGRILRDGDQQPPPTA